MTYTNTDISFKDTSTNEPNKYDWTFDDGTFLNGTTTNPVIHKYKLPGIYNVKHKAYNNCGVSNECTKELTLIDPPAEKWRCSDPLTNTCVRDDTNGTFTSESACKASSTCQPTTPPPPSSGILTGIIALGIGLVMMIKKK